MMGHADWSGIVVSAVVGRDRMLNVMPAGTMRDLPAAVPEENADLPLDENASDGDSTEEEGVGAPLHGAARELRAELIRLGRRYDLVVVAAPARAAQVGPDSILPVRDALVCARIAYTPLARLAAAVATLRDSRLRVRGIVLWDADVPPRLSES